jgi:hypothetical protein
MTEEERIARLLATFEELTKVAGTKENTKIIPNCEIIDATPSGLTGYIIVKNELGYNIPAIKSPDLTYNDGDFVNLLYIEGTEPIAFQHGSGSGTGGYPGSGQVKVSSNDTTAGYLEDKILPLTHFEFGTAFEGGNEQFFIDLDQTTIDHSQLDNLTVGDPHTQYVLEGDDLFFNNDVYGLWDRQVNYGFTPNEHWHDDTDDLVWTGWATYTGFVTPAIITTANSQYKVAHNAAAKAFRYRAASTGAAIWLRSRVALTYIVSAGLMLDDGVDDGDGEGATNFYRTYLHQASLGAAVNVVDQYRTGGGAVTTTTSTLSVDPDKFHGLGFFTNGTLWSNWNGVSFLFGEYSGGDQILNRTMAASAAFSWTPARVGLYLVFTAVDGGRRGMYDWYDEATA